MASVFFLASMASRTKNEKVMWLISEKFPKLLESLATNKNLPTDLWLKLFKKAPVGLAINLVNNRDLSREELKIALKDKRKTVKTYIFRNGFNPSFIREARSVLTAPWLTHEHVQLWLKSGKVNPKLTKEVIGKASEPVKVEYYRDESLFTNAEVVSALESLTLNYSSISSLVKLIEARPELVGLLIPQSRGALHAALAGNRTLFDQEVWSLFIGKLEADIKTSFARDAVWMALANPNLNRENTERLIAIADTLPKSIYQYKLLNIKQDALLKNKKILVKQESYQYVKSDWVLNIDSIEKSLIETAVTILNPARYPIYYKATKTESWVNPVPARGAQEKKDIEITLNFIPNKDRVPYSEELELLASRSLTRPEQWEILLGLLVDWDASFAELITTAVELSK